MVSLYVYDMLSGGHERLHTVTHIIYLFRIN